MYAKYKKKTVSCFDTARWFVDKRRLDVTSVRRSFISTTTYTIGTDFLILYYFLQINFISSKI